MTTMQFGQPTNPHTFWAANWSPNNFIITTNPEEYHGPIGAAYSGNCLTLNIAASHLNNIGIPRYTPLTLTIDYTVHSVDQAHLFTLWCKAGGAENPLSQEIGRHSNTFETTLSGTYLLTISTPWTGQHPGWLVFTIHSVTITTGDSPKCQLNLEIN